MMKGEGGAAEEKRKGGREEGEKREMEERDKS